jgi:hypothetical protein
VRYYEDDLLTYASYRGTDGGKGNLLTDYAAAVHFILADTHMHNRFYFTGFVIKGNGRHEFYFDYMMQDGPIYNTGDSHIQVVIERGTAIRYRKLAHNFMLERSY